MTPQELITLIATRFPTMRDRVHHTTWDVDEFMAHLGTASTGEQHAMRFIASVWNPQYAREMGWNFDAVEAVGSWDREHRLAFASWITDPRWP